MPALDIDGLRAPSSFRTCAPEEQLIGDGIADSEQLNIGGYFGWLGYNNMNP